MKREEMINSLIGKTVMVNVHGRVLPGVVAGRYSPWAFVHVPGQVAGICYSWDTIEKAIKEGGVLLV